MDPIVGEKQKDDKVLLLNDILSNRHQDEHVGMSLGNSNMPLPLSQQNISEIVAAVMAAAFPKTKVLLEGQPAATLQPVTGELQLADTTCLLFCSTMVLHPVSWQIKLLCKNLGYWCPVNLIAKFLVRRRIKNLTHQGCIGSSLYWPI